METVKTLFEEKRQEIIDANLPWPHFLKALRLSFGLKQAEVAKWCNMSRYRMYNFESGRTRVMDLDAVRLLGELYGIPLWYMRKKYYQYWMQ